MPRAAIATGCRNNADILGCTNHPQAPGALDAVKPSAPPHHLQRAPWPDLPCVRLPVRLQCRRVVRRADRVAPVPDPAADGPARLHVRAAPRGRRGPHRRHRQHDAQAHAGRSAAGRRRALLLARALDDRGRAVDPDRALGRDRQRHPGVPGDRRADRDERVGDLPARHRRHQPARADRHLPDVPEGVGRRRLRRGEPRGLPERTAACWRGSSGRRSG